MTINSFIQAKLFDIVPGSDSGPPPRWDSSPEGSSLALQRRTSTSGLRREGWQESSVRNRCKWHIYFLKWCWQLKALYNTCHIPHWCLRLWCKVPAAHLAFSVLLKNTSTCKGEPGFKPAILWSLDNLLHTICFSFALFCNRFNCYQQAVNNIWTSAVRGPLIFRSICLQLEAKWSQNKSNTSSS